MHNTMRMPMHAPIHLFLDFYLGVGANCSKGTSVRDVSSFATELMVMSCSEEM